MRIRPGRRDERGSMTVFVVLWSLVIVMVAALVIDVGLAISQRERAADLADQAARAEAQNLSTASLRQSGGAVIQDDGCLRARDYLTNAASSIHYGTATLDTGLGNGGCEVVGNGPGNSVTVSVNLTYSPFVFDLFSGTVTVTETGTATAATGN
ncbi:TadE/TadG family type IV pilus assembly protein [Actinospica sp.]|uniref:TadE/TadG family type IV pilus assembly protein n=1 Tax=Actinospica sp. TaxID=1872142 RepID=UPI002C2B7847|nr:pilus assembly protein TadG-related protein [Actinospica sp.]HWG27296.1 pilus assembly protein TadG-related protein [Actinospica sp.]